METAGKLIEIYASAAGVIAELWILLAMYPIRKTVKKWGIAVWFSVYFCLIHIMVFDNLIQSVAAMFFSIFAACLMLEGTKSEKVITIIEINIFKIALGMVEGRITYFITGENMADILAQGSGSAARMVGIIVDNTIYLLLAYMISRLFRERLQLKKEEIAILLIFFGLFCFIAILSIALTDYTALQFQVQFSLRWQIAFFALDLLLFFANIAILHVIIHLNRQNKYEMENVVLKIQLEQEKRQFHTEQQNYQNLRKLRHDMKRYITTYLQLLRSGECETVQREMEQMLNKRLAVERFRYVEDRMVNAVINEKMQICEEEKIKFDVDAALEHEGIIENAIIISNLLDNAIEAEKKEQEEWRYIHLWIRKEGLMMHVIVENYITESVLDKNPKLNTSKKTSQFHGIGLKGVQEYVRSQEGEIKIWEQDHSFIVQLCYLSHANE